MNKSIEQLEEGDVQNSQKNKVNLVLCIDKNEKITKFNHICEQISGYDKNEILKKSFYKMLIPDRYRDLWNIFFDYSKNNRTIHAFKIPFLTKHGHEIMISWSSFPVKDLESDDLSINLVGSLVTSWKDVETPEINIPLTSSKNKIKSLSLFSRKTKDSDINIKIIKQLKFLNNELEKKNKYLEKQLKTKGSQEDHYKEILDNTVKQSNIIVNKSLYSFSELYGGKKRKEEFENKLKELDEREKRLNNAEIKLLEDKKKVNEQINEFREWRERLELLEEDIENRRMDLMNQEKILLSDITGSDDVSVSETTKEDLKEPYDVFEKITDSAAIIQRGIFKKVNDSFANLIGYNANDIINRSLFDFISPEGLIGMEKYYLNRLKGEKISNYETVILSRNNEKIDVEINSKSTFLNGEKVEIAVFKLSLKNQEKIIDEAKIDVKSEDVVNSDIDKISNNKIDISQKSETIKEEPPIVYDFDDNDKEIPSSSEEEEKNKIIDFYKPIDTIKDSEVVYKKVEGKDIYKSENLKEETEVIDYIDEKKSDIDISSNEEKNLDEKSELEKTQGILKDDIDVDVIEEKTGDIEISEKENEIENEVDDSDKTDDLKEKPKDISDLENQDTDVSNEEEINKNRFNKSKEIKEE